MIILQVPLNFDPVKEILKIRCQIYILMEKVIILRKMHIKVFRSTILHPFEFEPDQKKKCGN